MFQAPYPPYDPTDKNGYETVVKRWPVILTNIIDTVYRSNHDTAIAAGETPSAEVEEKLAEGKKIIEEIIRLFVDFPYTQWMEELYRPVPEDGEAMVEVYNKELERLATEEKGTWFTAPWLYADYRFVRSYFAKSRHWKNYDPFAEQKESTFQKSGAAIYKLATTMHQLEGEKAVLESDPDKLEVIFREMVQMCLWYDLSLLTHMSHEDIQRLQAVGREAQKAQEEYILKDDQHTVWSHIKTLRNARVDFVLDNVAELPMQVFTDFVFADFLVTYTPYVSSVVFHAKAIPWFVSDVTPPDFLNTPSLLLSPSFFSETSHAADTVAKEHLHALVSRWKRYIAEGKFRLGVPLDSPLGVADPKIDFWTSPWPYWNMEVIAPELFKELTTSMLTGDVRWPVDTPFATAVGPLASSFPLLSLRTNKADVVVGVPQDIADALDKKDPKWAVNGKYALVSFLSGRTAGGRA
ncbi:DUF89 domain-containing protein [Vararia minispora EC-137]|uniref:DUF89 domain-containing protein n=1 Tax=Vararia minispora EC-137 TaxID=1314806 RepID=A0ACB8QYY7_9AGAM|nr:DUF89 domain-containing protein [Vararia minispora EC-137]